MTFGLFVNFSFSISAWQAFSPYHHQFSDWQQWAKEKETYCKAKEAVLPALTFIPAMQRRRLNLPAKLMFSALYHLDLPSDIPVVFASHDGETNRSFSLWLELLREGAMSPMSFGLSVHNAHSGSWSLFRGNQAEMNAVAANDGVLETALIEAVALLHDDAEEVAVVVVEEPLKEEYAVPASRAPFPYALALRVVKGNDYSLRYQGKDFSQSPNSYWQALDWIAAQCEQRREWQYSCAGGTWYWRRKI